MDEQQQSTENAPRAGREESPPPAPRPNPFAAAFSKINLTQIMLAVLTVIFVWQWFDNHRVMADLEQQLARKIAEMDGASKANQMLLAQSQEEVRELSAKITLLETRYAEAQNQRAALEALYNDLSVSRDETALAEVEQMLMIAGQQLQLSANIKAALIAMQSADARLQRMDRPAFNGLRKAIGRDMDKLRALPGVDITSLSHELDGLIAAMDSLPLFNQRHRAQKEETAQTAAPVDETVWQKLLREIWQDAKHLVRIENTGKAEIPLLPPDQAFFLRENLKLRLLSARLALLSRDEDSFRQTLKTAQSWIMQHFDTHSKETVHALDKLKKITGAPVSIHLPDISPSLQAVRNYRLMHEHAADRVFTGKPAK